jgi:hypothetical protein
MPIINLMTNVLAEVKGSLFRAEDVKRPLKNWRQFYKTFFFSLSSQVQITVFTRI